MMTAGSQNRRRFRVAGSTALVALSLSFANVLGFKSAELPDGSRFFFYGWPMIYGERYGEIGYDDASQQFTDKDPWLWAADVHVIASLEDEDDSIYIGPLRVVANLLISLVVLGCTWCVMASQKRYPRFPWQMTLRQFLIVCAVTSVYLALVRPLEWRPWITWKPLMFFPIVLGLLCVVAVVDSLLFRLCGKIRLSSNHSE